MKLYVTEMEPNGTRSLIVTDDNGQVIGGVDEAVFGNIPDRSGDLLGGLIVCYFGEDVALMDAENEELERVRNGELQDVYPVYEVYLPDVLKRIAVNPMDNGQGKVKQILKLVA